MGQKQRGKVGRERDRVPDNGGRGNRDTRKKEYEQIKNINMSKRKERKKPTKLG